MRHLEGVKSIQNIEEMIYRIVCLLAVLVGCGSLRAEAQTVISGRVLGADGAVMPATHVLVTSYFGGRRPLRVIAAPDGRYHSTVSTSGFGEPLDIRCALSIAEDSVEVDYAGTEWAWRAVISETGVENLFRVDVTVSYPGDEDGIRTVTGFIGEPVMPGQSNRSWNRGPGVTGVTE